MKKILLTTLLVVVTPLWAFAKPQVVASINPIYQILTAIAGDEADVSLLINSRVSEHHYQWKRDDVRIVHAANLVFYVDDGLEKNLFKLLIDQKSARKLTNIQGIRLLNKRTLSQKKDLHIWLNPRNAIKIASFMAAELAKIDPDHTKIYQKNLSEFKEKIAILEKKVFREMQNAAISGHVLFTQDYQYFEDYFAFKPLKVVLTGHGHDLRMSDIREFDLLVGEGKVTCVLGDRYDESNAVQKLARNHHLKYVALDLIGNPRNSESDYFQIIEDISSQISSCF